MNFPVDYLIPTFFMLVGAVVWNLTRVVLDWFFPTEQPGTEDAHARHLLKILGAITTCEHEAVVERLDAIEARMYNNQRVPYGSPVPDFRDSPDTTHW